MAGFVAAGAIMPKCGIQHQYDFLADQQRLSQRFFSELIIPR